MNNFYSIYNYWFDEGHIDNGKLGEFVQHYTVIYTGVRTDDGTWMQTVMVCDEDLGADGPYGYYVMVGELMDFSDLDTLVRECISDTYVGRRMTQEDDEWWETVFYLTESNFPTRNFTSTLDVA